MPDLALHLGYLAAELAAANAAPLSLRKAMLVVMLADAFADRLFTAQSATGDILAFRAGLATASPALAQLFAVAAQRPNGPRLAVETVPVPMADYGYLAVEDFMVSLYNDHSVQRLRIVHAGGTSDDALPVLAAAVAALRGHYPDSV